MKTKDMFHVVVVTNLSGVGTLDCYAKSLKSAKAKITRHINTTPKGSFVRAQVFHHGQTVFIRRKGE